MEDAAPQVARAVAGLSDTGHIATTIDVPILSPTKALKQLPYEKSHTRICLPGISPFATEAIASVIPAPMNGRRTIVTFGAGSS